MAAVPAEPLLVWSGNNHASKEVMHEWIPMGHHFAAMSGTDLFVIDQTVSVASEGRSWPWLPGLLTALGEIWPPTVVPPGSSVTRHPLR